MDCMVCCRGEARTFVSHQILAGHCTRATFGLRQHFDSVKQNGTLVLFFFFSRKSLLHFVCLLFVLSLCTKVSRFWFVYLRIILVFFFFLSVSLDIHFFCFCSFIHILIVYVLFSKYRIIELCVYVFVCFCDFFFFR